MQLSRERGVTQAIMSVHGIADVLDEPTYFCVDLERNYSDLLLRRMEVARRIQIQDAGLFEVSYLDWTGEFFKGIAESHSKRAESQDVDCCYQLVYPDSIAWEAVLTHSDIHLITERLPIGPLRGCGSSGN